MNEDRPATLLTALLLGCVGVFAIMVGPIMTETLVSSLGYSADTAGQIFAVEALGTALAPLAAAFWMSRVSWRLAAVVALAIVIGGNLVSSWQTDAGTLTLLRFLTGLLGQGTAFVLAIGLISGTREKDRNFAYLIAAQVVLGVLAFVLLPLPAGSGVRGVLLPLAGLALLTMATVGFIPPPATAAAAQAGHATPSAASGAQAWIALGVMLIWCTGLGAIWAFVKLIGTAGGLSPESAGLALGISSGVAILGALAASWLAPRTGRLVPVTVALTVQVAMIALLQGPMSFVQFAVTASVFQTFWNMTGPFLMGTVALSDPSGKVSLLIPTAQIGGFFLGPILAGRLLTGQGFAPANWLAMGCCLLALAIFVPTALRLKRQLAAAT
jgi:predicted MFS family arabinose efflux permease